MQVAVEENATPRRCKVFQRFRAAVSKDSAHAVRAKPLEPHRQAKLQAQHRLATCELSPLLLLGAKIDCEERWKQLTHLTTLLARVELPRYNTIGHIWSHSSARGAGTPPLFPA